MSMEYITREGPIATLDTRTQLTTQGSNTSPGPVLVPAGKTKIKQIIYALGDNTPTGADMGNNFFLTLSGSGIKDGEQYIPLAGMYADFTTAGDTGSPFPRAHLLDVDIDVESMKPIGIFVEMTAGAALAGAPEVSVTLGFA
jgi:hypothetical protein